MIRQLLGGHATQHRVDGHPVLQGPQVGEVVPMTGQHSLGRDHLAVTDQQGLQVLGRQLGPSQEAHQRLQMRQRSGDIGCVAGQHLV